MPPRLRIRRNTGSSVRAIPPFLAQVVPLSGLEQEGNTGRSVRAIPPFLAQVVPLPGLGRVDHLRSPRRYVPRISSPPGGGNLVQCLGLRPPGGTLVLALRIMWRILPTQGRGPPVGPAERGRPHYSLRTSPAA